MRREDARKIISKHSLVPRKFSKILLSHIVENRSQFDPRLEDLLSTEDFERLKHHYIMKIEELGGALHEGMPRNLPFYLMVKDILPEFSWEIQTNGQVVNKRYVVKLNCPYVDGLRPTITSLLLNLVECEAKTDLHKLYRSVYALDGETVDQLSKFLRKVGAVRLKGAQMENLVDWIKRGMQGAESTVLTPICPDYAYESLGSSLYIFTFDGIGIDVGVTAKRLVSAVKDVHQFFHHINTPFRHIAAIGDFEAFSNANCERVGVSEEVFIESLKLSQAALQKESPAPLEVPMFTDLCNGRKQWERTYNEILEQFIIGNFGHTGLEKLDLKKIANARKPLYRRWYGELTDEEAMEIVIRQGAEYATMGSIALSELKNPLILGADHAKMAPFYSFKGQIPTLYLTSSYIKDS